MYDDELIFGGDFFDLEEELVPTSEKLQLREGELREVTVLFADIRGFSSISNLFDAETIHRKMDEIMKIFSRCIGFYGGFVDKYMGDGIMALFGAKQATEQDTERALLAALKMQQQLRLYNALLNRQAGFEKVELGVRVGINAGLVSVGKVGEDREGDFTVYGPEVNLASRMESNAPVNRIMVPEKIMRAVQRNFEFEAAGAKTVKGFDTPIECYLLLGPKLNSSLHRRNHATRYIGRNSELQVLQSAFEALQKGKGFVIAGIKGEAGLGKTRLVYEFELANADKAMFLHGACSVVSPAPLNLFSSLLETLFALQIAEPTERKLAKLERGYADLLAGCLESERKTLEENKALIAFLLEIKSDDPRLKQSGSDLLAHLSLAIEVLVTAHLNRAKRENKPLVLVLDDLHWLDEASARVLENLLNKFAMQEHALQVMLVLMFRLEYQLPSYFSSLAEVTLIELRALQAAEIKELIISHTTEKALDEATLDKVVQLSQGNPFFLEEWCNYIEELPADELKDFPVPANLHTLILSRLDKLPPALRMLLHKASVIGQEFFVEILRYMETRLNDPIDIDATLGNLVDQSLILRMLGFEYSNYFFKHITTREVAYQTLLAENRKLLHQLCGEAIEALYPQRLEEFYYALAEHFSKAEVADKAMQYLELAATDAARIYNNKQALQLYEKLLAHPSLPQEKSLEIQMKLADIQWLTGDWAAAIQRVESLLPVAKKLQIKEICFEAHRFFGIAAFYQGNLEAAKDEFSGSLQLAKELDSPKLLAIATGNLGNWYFQQQQFDQARALQQQSLELAQQTKDMQRQAKTLSNLGLICLEEKDLQQAERYFAESLKIAEENQLLKEQSIALGNMGFARLLAEDYEAAMPLLHRKLTLAQNMNDKLELINALGNIANLHLEQGDISTAKESFNQIIALRQYLGDENGAKKVQDFLATLDLPTA